MKITIKMWTVVVSTTIRKARNHCQNVDHCQDEGNCQYHLGIDQSGWKPLSGLIETPVKMETRRSVEHCTPHADGAWLNELGWSQ